MKPRESATQVSARKRYGDHHGPIDGLATLTRVAANVVLAREKRWCLRGCTRTRTRKSSARQADLDSGDTRLGELTAEHMADAIDDPLERHTRCWRHARCAIGESTDQIWIPIGTGLAPARKKNQKANPAIAMPALITSTRSSTE